jgi:type II secretory pathway component GspD/PulD (secretin)
MKKKHMLRIFMSKKVLQMLAIISAAGLSACGASNPPEISEGHISMDEMPASIPEPVLQSPVLPEPEHRPNLETYTVVVNQVPVRELLFSMARDAKINLDIDNNIKGKVTMNAIDQTLPQILERLSRQADIRYQLEDESLRVMPDNPYLELYDVNYLNMSRTSKGAVEVSSEISSTGSGAGAAGGSKKGGNNSKSVVNNVSNNDFWRTLSSNISNLIGEDAKAAKGSALSSSKNIIVNQETGVLGVRATYRQQRHVQEFLDKVINSAQRQVMIEATIAEVTLSDHYQAGIDWSVISAVDASSNITRGASQDLLGGTLGATPFFQVSAIASNNGRPITATLKALETFGDVKVLSSPKIMALNNQTAMLKVVDNEVYFTIEVEASTTVVGGVATHNAFL